MVHSNICPNCGSSNLKSDVQRSWRVPSGMKPSQFLAHCNRCGSLLRRYYYLEEQGRLRSAPLEAALPNIRTPSASVRREYEMSPVARQREHFVAEIEDALEHLAMS